ncbi:MAG TPA: hypothetical protein PKH26_17920 [Phycisphaerae bacterium]|nr:hypothetical protein [Phycisphaerae bacterium]
MARASYYARRYAVWSANDSGWTQIIREDRDAKNWGRPSHLPGTSVSTPLHFGLDCLYVGDVQRGRVFVERAIRNADRLTAEGRYLDTEIARAGHPRNLAEILRGRVYARWLLGEALDRRTLHQVAEYIATFCRTKADDRKSFNDSTTMNDYLQSVRAALIACDLDYAGQLLNVRDRFRWHHGREKDLWLRLARMHPDLTDEFDEEFERFFDRVRDPDFLDSDEIGRVHVDRDCLALETGILREMYIINASPYDDPSPQAVIDAVAR